MAMVIDVDECTVCGDCEPMCPTGAIGFTGETFTIDASRCNECVEKATEPRCIGVCPVDFCIQPLVA